MALSPLPRFLALYAALYAAFGVQSPFLPALLSEHGLGPAAVGLVLACATVVRLVAGPGGGWLADRLVARRAVLACSLAGAALVALAYLPAQSFGLFLTIGVLHAALLAPPAPVTDALALSAAASELSRAGGRAFDYGWVRGTGAAAFILATILAGKAIDVAGIDTVIWLHVALLGATAAIALQVPQFVSIPSPGITGVDRWAGIGPLLCTPVFNWLVLVAALIQGSHALQDSFAVIRWEAAGVPPSIVGLLWAELVAGEVAVFFFLGRPLLDRLGPAGASALAAAAGVLRWAVMAQTAAVPAMALVQPLHGLTFALQHLACIRLLAQIAPPHLMATALTIYGTLGVGAATALLTLGGGPLYARFGPASFWLMAGLCTAALPLTWTLRQPRGHSAS